jgi:hypothetical protein
MGEGENSPNLVTQLQSIENGYQASLIGLDLEMYRVLTTCT